METYFEQDFDCFWLWPVLYLVVARCTNPDCGEDHGVCISIGWLFWSLNFHFPRNGASNP